MYLISEAALYNMVTFGMEHPDTEFSVEANGDEQGGFLSCVFFEKDSDNHASGFWELDEQEEKEN